MAEPITAEVVAKAHELFNGVTMMRHLEVELTEVEDECAEMAFTVGDKHGNYVGALHGGAIAAVMDTAVFFPGTLIPSGRLLTTEGLEVHYFRPVKMGKRVKVRARIIRNGRRVITVEAKATDEDGKEIAMGIATLLDLKAG